MIRCLKTRGVHVEVVHSLEADDCLVAIMRFSARRTEAHVFQKRYWNEFCGRSQSNSREESSLESIKH